MGAIMEPGAFAASLRLTGRLGRTAWRGAVDLLVPPACIACREAVAEPGRLCAACWGEARLIDGPVCGTCGAPFPHPMPSGTQCGDCLRAPPSYGRARSAGFYEGALRRLIIGLKHGDRWDAVPFLTALMARAGAELVAEADALVPVPLHALRRIGRRFNQAALLARALGRTHAKPVLVGALVRRRHTRPQVGLTRAGRARNVRGAFAVRPASLPLLAGRRLLLVDDVMTTGATVEACARALLAAGAEEVLVLAALRAGAAD